MTLAGFRDDDGVPQPTYVFQYEQAEQQAGMPVHDHRDAVTGGGFSFAVYHPGSGVPMQPWAL